MLPVALKGDGLVPPYEPLIVVVDDDPIVRFRGEVLSVKIEPVSIHIVDSREAGSLRLGFRPAVHRCGSDWTVGYQDSALTMRVFFIWLIRGYQLVISPLFPASCRYYPTCSAYAVEAFERYGVGRGMKLTVKRLLRCHPFRSGGFDPVP